MSLKDKINAKAQEIEAKNKADIDENARYRTTVMRELPRLFSELLSMVREQIEGAEGVTIRVLNPQIRDIKLGEEVIGRARLDEFEIMFKGRGLSFTDDPGPWMGVDRKIAITATRATNPFEQGLNVIENREIPDEWRIWVPAEKPKPGRARHPNDAPALLTPDLLEKRLEQFFLV